MLGNCSILARFAHTTVPSEHRLHGLTNLNDRAVISIKMQNSPPKPMDKYKIEDVRMKTGREKVRWPSLQPAQFRHPLDSQATLAIQRLFPLESLVRQGMGGVIEQVVYLDNLSNSIRVGRSQLPKIYDRSIRPFIQV